MVIMTIHSIQKYQTELVIIMLLYEILYLHVIMKFKLFLIIQTLCFTCKHCTFLFVWYLIVYSIIVLHVLLKTKK